MSYFFFENPWAIFWVLLPILVVLVSLALTTGRRGFFVLSLLVLFGLLLPFGLDTLVETPAEEVDLLLDRLVDAILAKDAQTLLQAISPDYDFQGKNHQKMISILRRVLDQYDIRSLRTNGRETETTGPDSVTSNFVVAADVRGPGVRVPNYRNRLRLDFEEEKKSWKIISVEQLPLVGKTDHPIPLQIP